jgi:tetratricopeptide (TPR) repeat protein
VSVAAEDWNEAAVRAANLSELWLTLGEVANALALAEQSVEYADQSGDAFDPMLIRTALADALHQAGERARAEELFQEAERMQAERQPEYPRLYSLRAIDTAICCSISAATPRSEAGRVMRWNGPKWLEAAY